MEEERSDVEESTTSIVSIDKMSLDETQIAEQLYNSAGLDPVVNAGLKDYDERLQLENRLMNKVLGTRGSDIRAYGESVAKRVALAIYTQLNRQYGGKVGDLRSHIMDLEEERDRANIKYDELMGRVVGILGDEYKELRTDSKAFVEKLTTVLGEDLKDSRLDQREFTERLADIDDLRSQIAALDREKEHLRQGYESQLLAQENKHKEEMEELRSQIAELNREKGQLREEHESDAAARKKEHDKEVRSLRSQIARLGSTTEGLESDKATLTSDLTQLREVYTQFKMASESLDKAIPYEEMRVRLGEELHGFILQDSKVPDAVIEGVGKFIDLKKYLAMAVERGAREAQKHTEEILSAIPQPTDDSPGVLDSSSNPVSE
jgi:hypothetical protein